jgi:hypothetical protein
MLLDQADRYALRQAIASPSCSIRTAKKLVANILKHKMPLGLVEVIIAILDVEDNRVLQCKSNAELFLYKS